MSAQPHEEARDELDDWTEQFPENAILRRVSPPRPVTVDMGRVFPGEPGLACADGLSLRVRAGGIRLEQMMRGTLRAWLRCSDGRWLAQVCVPVNSANGYSHLNLRLWVEATTISPLSPTD
jgi:hypothetical protein